MYKTLIATAFVAVSANAQDAFDFEITQDAALGGYSSSQALISRQLSADAYCGYSAYMSHKFEGKATGFIATKTLYD